MEIRIPTFQDYDRVMQLLIDMSNTTDIVAYHNPTYRDKYIRNLITELCCNGCFYVAEDKGEIHGLIAGMIQPQIWLPHVNLLVESAFYVTPEYRHTTMGARLFKKYRDTGKQLLDSGDIDTFSITQNDNFNDFDYSKHGFDKAETIYVWSDA